MNRDQKEVAVKEISANLSEAGSVFAFDYRGISVSQGADLRAQLLESDTSFRVVKNRLAKLALAKADSPELEGFLAGPTAIAFVRGDPVVAAKTLDTFARANGVPTFKGGIMDGAALDADSFSAIARLPDRDVLHAQLVWTVASPITSLARGLNQLLGGFAQQLREIRDQGLVTGEDPPATESAASDVRADEASQDNSDPAALQSGADDAVQAVSAESPAGGSEAEVATGDEPGPEASESQNAKAGADGEEDSESKSDPAAAASGADEAPASESAEGGTDNGENSTDQPDPRSPASESAASNTGDGENSKDSPTPTAPSEAQDVGGENKED